MYVSMQIVLLNVSNTQLIVILCNWFSIGVNDQSLREIESIFFMFDCPKVQLFIRWCYWMLIHMQIALLKVRSRSWIPLKCSSCLGSRDRPINVLNTCCVEHSINSKKKTLAVPYLLIPHADPDERKAKKEWLYPRTLRLVFQLINYISLPNNLHRRKICSERIAYFPSTHSFGRERICSFEFRAVSSTYNFTKLFRG